MKFRAKIDEQGSELHDGIKTDYGELDAEEMETVPVTVSYDYDHVVGSAHNFELKDGELWCDVDLDEGLGVSAHRNDLTLAPEMIGRISDEEEFSVEEIRSVSFVFNRVDSEFENEIVYESDTEKSK